MLLDSCKLEHLTVVALSVARVKQRKPSFSASNSEDSLDHRYSQSTRTAPSAVLAGKMGLDLVLSISSPFSTASLSFV